MIRGEVIMNEIIKTSKKGNLIVISGPSGAGKSGYELRFGSRASESADYEQRYHRYCSSDTVALHD